VDPIYLDHAATTPLDPSVVAAMADALANLHGNPANSSHAAGRAAIAAMDIARREVAALIGGDPARTFFTSGATEANNLAIRGVVQAVADTDGVGPVRDVLVRTAIEHRSVCCPMDELVELLGLELRIAPVTTDGVVDLDALDTLLDDRVLLVAAHLANNEIGTVQPIAELTRRAHAVGAVVLCDATQAVGKVPVDLAELGDVDLLSLSAHKFHGPKGSGALHVGLGVALTAQVSGGGQECGLRAGTPNVPAIVGMGVAARIADAELTAGHLAHVREQRERFEREVLALDDRAYVNGAEAPRLPGIASITFPGREGGQLVAELAELQISRGSACSTGSPKPSHVLTALGRAPGDVFATLRVSLGSTTTAADVDRAIAAFRRVLTNERSHAATA